MTALLLRKALPVSVVREPECDGENSLNLSVETGEEEQSRGGLYRDSPVTHLS